MFSLYLFILIMSNYNHRNPEPIQLNAYCVQGHIL